MYFPSYLKTIYFVKLDELYCIVSLLYAKIKMKIDPEQCFGGLWHSEFLFQNSRIKFPFQAMGMYYVIWEELTSLSNAKKGYGRSQPGRMTFARTYRFHGRAGVCSLIGGWRVCVIGEVQVECNVGSRESILLNGSIQRVSSKKEFVITRTPKGFNRF